MAVRAPAGRVHRRTAGRGSSQPRLFQDGRAQEPETEPGPALHDQRQDQHDLRRVDVQKPEQHNHHRQGGEALLLTGPVDPQAARHSRYPAQAGVRRPRVACSTRPWQNGRGHRPGLVTKSILFC